MVERWLPLTGCSIEWPVGSVGWRPAAWARRSCWGCLADLPRKQDGDDQPHYPNQSTHPPPSIKHASDPFAAVEAVTDGLVRSQRGHMRVSQPVVIFGRNVARASPQQWRRRSMPVHTAPRSAASSMASPEPQATPMSRQGDEGPVAPVPAPGMARRRRGLGMSPGSRLRVSGSSAGRPGRRWRPGARRASASSAARIAGWPAQHASQHQVDESEGPQRAICWAGSGR